MDGTARGLLQNIDTISKPAQHSAGARAGHVTSLSSNCLFNCLILLATVKGEPSIVAVVKLFDTQFKATGILRAHSPRQTQATIRAHIKLVAIMRRPQ